MSDWHDVCDENDLPLGEMRPLKVDFYDVLVTHTERGLDAVSNMCPHALHRLDDGLLEDGTITCAIHAWCFDLASGRSLRPYGVNLRVYAVRVHEGRIQVRIPQLV